MNLSSPTHSSAIAGPLVEVAGGASFQLILSGLAYAVAALLLLTCGLVINYIVMTESGKIGLLGVGIPFTLIGALVALAGIRRFRAVCDQRIYLRAGPDGVVIGMPTKNLSNMVRAGFRFVVHEMAWKEIRTWYPYIVRVNGIPSNKSLVFEGIKGWRLSVPLLFYAGSCQRITDDISQAIGRTDLK